MVIYHDDSEKSCEAPSSNQRLLTDGGQTDTDTDTERVDRLDELELSVHHRVETNPIQAAVEYEIHAGRADVVEIPISLVEAAATVTGVDIRTEDVRCGAEVRFVDNPEPITDGGRPDEDMERLEELYGLPEDHFDDEEGDA